jgi:hypothetical protein
MQRVTSFLTNYKVSVPAIGLVLVGLVWLAFGYFGVHTLFIDEEVSEALPTFDAAPIDAEPAAATGNGQTPAEPTTTTTNPPVAQGDRQDDTTSNEPAELAEPAGEPAASEIVTEYAGQFESGAHPTSGQAVVLGNGTGQRFLRFEDFATDNGPDLNVYLVNSSTGDVSDYVDLGDLTGNIGEQNYEIPAGVDLDVYDQVVIWCVRFGVSFGDAEIMPAA